CAPAVCDGCSSIGASWGDYDNDGDLDLFVANSSDQNNDLYTNEGNGLFTKVVGVPIVSDAGWSRSGLWGDYDNDGDLDLFVTNFDDNFLYVNEGAGTFSKVTTGLLVTDGRASLGAAWGDYDNDGWLDLIVANRASRPNNIYSNKGSGNHWINIALTGTQSNVSAIGAKVFAKATISGNPVWQLREVASQTGFLSQNSLNVEFGLGNATTIDSVRVEWPSGIVQVLTGVAADQFLSLTEEEPVSRPTVATLLPSNITATSATLNGLINPNGETTTARFQWGATTAYGNEAIVPGTLTGVGNVPVSATLSGLLPGSTYHYLVIAANRAWDIPGGDQQFTTPADTNTTIDVIVIAGDTEVTFPGTSVTLAITFTGGAGNDTIEVSQTTTTPTGTIPATVELLAARFWEINHFGSGQFTVDITLVLGPPGTISAQDQAAPANIKLLRRADADVELWTVIAAAEAATDSSATFGGLTGFSQFTVGKGVTLDTQAPVIATPAIAPPAPVAAGTEIVVTATVTDNVGVNQVELLYARGGASSYTPVTMTAGAAGAFSASIPATAVTVRGVVFFVRANDTAPSPNADTTATRFVAVTFQGGTLTTASTNGSAFSSGFPRDQWRLISVPSAPSNNAASTIIGGRLGAIRDTTWKLFEYTRIPTDQWRLATSLARGNSYWLYQQVQASAQFDAGAGRTDNLQNFAIPLPAGPDWNLIANPYPFPVSIQLGQNDFFGPLTYDGSGWSGILTQLAPWGGYIVYNRTSSSQTISVTATPGGGAAKELLAKGQEAPAGWLLRLAAVGQTYTDRANAIGQLEGASDALDHFDNPEPPYVDGYISLAMERDDWGANLPRFSTDIRSPEAQDGVWDMALYVRGEQGPITLSTQLQGDWPPGHRMVLLDLLTRREHDLLSGGGALTITRYREDFPYHLKVVAGSAAYVTHALDQILAALPSDFALAPNYPNPFNPNTTLRYSLIRPARVNLAIYDLRGREVITLLDGWQDLGHYEVVWDGRDRSGSRAASGLYFAAYRVAGQLFTRKMVLMK
ncbi:MAG: VCBS repeat-containing protein, partial [Candidatus Marinimicrobia bacterium]|nr:VCBS repeat-containing protein [Candidatus Neomarinimicrobiota bacterium]